MLDSHSISSFPVVRYHLHGTVQRRVDFPDFAGSALRGAFGHALKRAACVTGQTDCKPCPLYRRCAYPAIFETPPPLDARRSYANIPQPYVIEPPSGSVSRAAGEGFDFELVLIGPAIERFKLIAHSLHQALQDIGRGSVRLRRIDSETRAPILDLDTGTVGTSPPSALIIPGPPADLRSVTLRFSTPFALARNGKELPPSEISARDILMSAVRRVAELTELQLGQKLAVDFAELAQQAADIRAEVDLQPARFSRHSSRQKASMPMHGHLGTISLHGPLAPFWPFLHLGQWLHIGKKCVFGFGRYTLHT